MKKTNNEKINKKINVEDKQDAKGKKKGLLRYVKLKSLIILLIMLMLNSYAWFIFATRAANDMQVHVTSWNVNFKVNDQDASTDISIDVGQVYPGMPVFEKEVSVVNTGEMSAELTYDYKKVIIFDETYVVDDVNITQEEIKQMMEVDNPFKVNVIIRQINEDPENSDGRFLIQISWPYESGNDQLDTQWGEKAYEFYEKNEDKNSLHIELVLIAEQKT